MSIESEPAPPPRPEITGFPAWIKACGAVVGLLVLYSAVRIGPVFDAAITVERVQKQLERQDNRAVISELEPLLRKYPDMIDQRLDLAQAYVATKNLERADATLEPLNGKEVSQEQGERASEIDKMIQQAAREVGGSK